MLDILGEVPPVEGTVQWEVEGLGSRTRDFRPWFNFVHCAVFMAQTGETSANPGFAFVFGLLAVLHYLGCVPASPISGMVAHLQIPRVRPLL